MMNAVGWLGNCLSQGVGVVSGPFHPFGGAIDIIVVEQPDGSFKSSPWYVQFGKFQGVLKTTEKVVNISVNGVEADFHMYLNHKGEAYFLEEVEVPEGESAPFPLSSGDETDAWSQMDRLPLKSKSCDFDVDKLDSASQIDLSNGEIVARAGSRRSRILGFVFGRKSIKERELQDGSVPTMERASSLDCAEFAADLLEVNWSTILAGEKMKKDSSLPLPPPATSSGRPDGDIKFDNEQSPSRSLVVENDDNNLVDNGLHEIAAAHCKQTVVSLQSTSDYLDGSVEDVCIETLCSSPQEHDAATSVMIENVNENICVISRETDEYTTGHADGGDETSLDCTFKNADPNSQISCFAVCKVSPSKQFDGQNALEEKVFSPVSQDSKENITERVQTFYYCHEFSERPIGGFNGSTKQLHGTICISSVNHEELHVHADSVHASSDPQEQSAVSEGLDNHTGLEAVVIDPDNHYQLTNSSKLACQDIDEINHQMMLQCSTQMLAAEHIPDSVEEVKPQSISFVSSSSDSSHRVQDGSITSDEKINKQPSLGYSDFIKNKEFNDQVPYNSDEKQFVSSELDQSELQSTCCAGSLSLAFAEDKSDPISSPRGPRGNEDDNGSRNSNQELFLYSDKSRPEEQLNDLESSTVMSKMMSNPVNIPESCKPTSEEGLQHVKSLPNMFLHMEDLDTNNTRYPLSQSVESDSKSKSVLLREKGRRFKDKEAECSYSLELGQPNNEDTQNSVEQNNTLSWPTVEISLCKHLLYEGMGADAASGAFDSQKLDIDKFSNMDTEIVKDDRLVFKIGGCYFPWDAAAAHVLGLHSCGGDLIFEPKDSIPVEEAKKCSEGDPSKAATASPGSWRLWPFSSKGSRSIRVMQPDLNGPRTYVYENASQSSTGADVKKDVHRPRVVKKTKRTKTPTSEQMASLKLREEMKFKEGMNLVTFTFSTPMLGEKKVDARIYLWKWNTRIVISDVDGTITKSDVLGQFMPFVGIDWSQTGVTNLFSAIKENGYQILFLSARSISQAYHTRQFLLNLKQDGKLLPDGPVVISPDGLFPSLFREVIRRVPQEFKIACLKNIKALFPSEYNPFYAGFGNRDTDELSYLNVGIPRGKIFIINPRGEVALSRCVETKSYTSLHALVNGVFPPMSSDEQEDYNQWNYWKLPTPAMDI